jgi:O-antigen/teichoic acid export membrane protein
MASTAVLAVSGFLFWIIATHNYSANTIGIASTLISIITLLSTVCLLGLNITLINHIPKAKAPSTLVNSGVTIVAVFSVLLAVIVGYAASYFSPQLSVLRNDKLFLGMFTFFALLSTTDTVVEGALIAFRNSGAVLAKNAFYSIVKVVLVAVVTGASLIGLFSAYYLGLLACFMISYVALKKYHSYHIRTKINTQSLRKVMKTSLGNYTESIATVAPPALLPLLITGRLGAAETAYFYLAMVIANTIYSIPKAVARNIIVELSEHNDNTAFKESAYYRGAKVLAYILTPVVGVIILVGKPILHIFGNNYAVHGYIPLIYLAIAVIPISMSSILWADMNAHNESFLLFKVNVIGGVVTILLCYLLLPYGLNGVGGGWLIGQVVQTVLYILPVYKRKSHHGLHIKDYFLK